MSGVLSRQSINHSINQSLPLPVMHRSQSPSSTLTLSPDSSRQSSPSMSAQVHHADLPDLSSKMLINDHVHDQSIIHSVNQSVNQSTNPLDALLSAAVPSPSNMRSRAQGLRVSVSSNIPSNQSMLNQSINQSINQSMKFQHPFLQQSPGDSPGYNLNMHSPFMGLTSMSPLTGTTASHSSIQSLPPVMSSMNMPGSPLSVWTPNMPHQQTSMMSSGMSTQPIIAQFEGHLNDLCRELELLFPLLVPTGPVNSASMRIVDPDRWYNLAVPLSAEPLRHLVQSCRLLTETRKNVLSNSLHITAVRKNTIGMPPSLMDNEVNACFSFVCGEAYYHSAQLRSLHSIIKNIVGHAYKRATGIDMPNRTTREDEVSSQGTQRQCRSCSQLANVSILFSCNHVHCWKCVGIAMMTEKDSPCSQCSTTWLHQRDSAYLDENEALVLASQYMQSSFSLPSRSPLGSPLISSFSHPQRLSASLDDSQLSSSSFKKRKVSPNAIHMNDQQTAFHSITQSQFHHPTASAFSRRVGHGNSSPAIPNTSPQFGASSPLPHNPSWSPNIITQAMNYQPPSISLSNLSHFNQLQQQLAGDPNLARHQSLARTTHAFPIMNQNSMAMNPAQSPTLSYGFVGVHGNTYPSYAQFQQTYQNTTQYQTGTPHPFLPYQMVHAPEGLGFWDKDPNDPRNAQDQKRVKREIKTKTEKKSSSSSKKSVVKKEKKSDRRRKESSSESETPSDREHQEGDDGQGGLLNGTVYPFLCTSPGCNDSFKTRFSLKRHAKKHSGVKPFICEYPKCGKQFAEKSTLKRHLRIHTGEKPYMCSMDGCGKMFADRTNVKRHEMIHSGERPYWCTAPGCKRGYFWRKHLRQHHLSVHGIVQDSPSGLGNHPEQTLALQGLLRDDEDSGPSSAGDSTDEDELPKKKKRS